MKLDFAAKLMKAIFLRRQGDKLNWEIIAILQEFPNYKLKKFCLSRVVYDTSVLLWLRGHYTIWRGKESNKRQEWMHNKISNCIR